MSLPAPDLYIHHTVTNATSSPAADMRAVENIDIARFGYPSYSYVIHPSGVVLEGMNIHIGAHTYQHNSTSFGVAFIGNFEIEVPTPVALDAFVELGQWMISTGKVRAGVPTGGHRDVYATACPGANLYPLIPNLRAKVAAGPTQPKPKDQQLNAIFSNSKGDVQIAEYRPANRTVYLRGIAKGSKWYNTNPFPSGKDVGDPISMSASNRPDGTVDVAILTTLGVQWVTGTTPTGFNNWYIPG